MAWTDRSSCYEELSLFHSSVRAEMSICELLLQKWRHGGARVLGLKATMGVVDKLVDKETTVNDIIHYVREMSASHGACNLARCQKIRVS